ncbi:MAG: hypothetical protein R3C11_15810 [Planctomycetaceae bacterium]
MIPLNCPKCNAPFQEDDYNQDLGVAKCSFCEAWIKLDELQQEADPLRQMPVDTIPVPDHITIHQNSHELKIVVKSPIQLGKSLGSVIRLSFTIGPIIFLSIMVFFILSSPLPNVAVIFPVIIGLMIIFSTRKVGSVMQSVSEDRVITVEKHGSLYCQKPILGGEAKSIPSRDIKQLYCTQTFQSSSPALKTNQRHLMNTIFDVNVLDFDNNSSVVLAGISSKSDAILIERQIEEFLGIAHEPVPGEID